MRSGSELPSFRGPHPRCGLSCILTVANDAIRPSRRIRTCRSLHRLRRPELPDKPSTRPCRLRSAAQHLRQYLTSCAAHRRDRSAAMGGHVGVNVPASHGMRTQSALSRPDLNSAFRMQGTGTTCPRLRMRPSTPATRLQAHPLAGTLGQAAREPRRSNAD